MCWRGNGGDNILIEYSFGKEFDTLFEGLKTSPHYEELANLDGIGKHQLDMVQFSKKFFGNQKAVADVSVDSSAMVDNASIVSYEVEVSKPTSRINAYYMLYKYAKKRFGKKYAEKLVQSQFNKDFYINDFHKFASMPYCFNFSCLDVVFQGLPFVDKIHSEPPKHLLSFVEQMVQFVSYASNQTAGAVGLADFLICCSWFYQKDSVLDSDVKQLFQTFIFSVNQPFRSGHQSAFTNVSIFDKVFLEKLCGEYSFPDGSKPDMEAVERMQDLFMGVMSSTLKKTPFTFPVTTACFSVDEERNIKDEKFMDKIVRENEEFGWINIFAGKTSTLSSCCRLRSEANHEYFNSFGAGGTKIGSMSVTTLNLPRIAYKVLLENYSLNLPVSQEKTKKDFLSSLADMVIMAQRVNSIKRDIVSIRVKNGNLPLYTFGFMDIKKQYSTCGVNGINEACEILGLNILEEDGQKFVSDLLDTVNNTNSVLEKEFGFPHNCEQTPSENSAIKLAQADKILGYGEVNKEQGYPPYELYSNQFIPLTVKADLFDRVILQGYYDSKMTGGAILHVNVGEKVSNQETMKKFLKSSIKLGVIYQAINYVLNVCEDRHVTVGSSDICTICGKPIVDKLTRVVGFLTSVKNWHKVRRAEDFPKRQFYKL